MNRSSKQLTLKSHKLTRAQVELCFIRVTRNQDVKGLGGSIQRSELYEMIVRCAQSWIYQVYAATENIATKFNEYINIYLKPIYENSVILDQYHKIRSSTQLNQLLYDNIKALQKIFDGEKQQDGKEQFQLENAQSMFMSLDSWKLKVSYEIIH